MASRRRRRKDVAALLKPRRKKKRKKKNTEQEKLKILLDNDQRNADQNKETGQQITHEITPSYCKQKNDTSDLINNIIVGEVSRATKESCSGSVYHDFEMTHLVTLVTQQPEGVRRRPAYEKNIYLSQTKRQHHWFDQHCHCWKPNKSARGDKIKIRYLGLWKDPSCHIGNSATRGS